MGEYGILCGMDSIISPFTPGRPVPVEYFVGRESEVTTLLSFARVSSYTEKLKVCYVYGAWGNGKSSIASFVQHMVQRRHNMAGAHVRLGRVRDLDSAICCIFDGILQESIGKPWYEAVKGFLGDGVEQTGAFGVAEKFNPKPSELSGYVNGFIPKTRELLGQLQRVNRKGLFLILDDIDDLADSSEFFAWLGNTAIKIADDAQPFPLCIAVAVTEDRHADTMRLYFPVDTSYGIVEMPLWGYEDTMEFYRNMFSRAGVKITKSALDALAASADGVPYIAHELGDAIFRTADSMNITEHDAIGAIAEGITLSGMKTRVSLILSVIENDAYLSILKKIVFADTRKYCRSDIAASEVSGIVSDKERKVLDDFFKKMVNIGLFETDPMVPGQYYFTNHLYLVCLRFCF